MKRDHLLDSGNLHFLISSGKPKEGNQMVSEEAISAEIQTLRNLNKDLILENGFDAQKSILFYRYIFGKDSPLDKENKQLLVNYMTRSNRAFKIDALEWVLNRHNFKGDDWSTKDAYASDSRGVPETIKVAVGMYHGMNVHDVRQKFGNLTYAYSKNDQIEIDKCMGYLRKYIPSL